MKNLKDEIDGLTLFRKFAVTDLLFTEYKCLEEASFFKIWSHTNYFVYVLQGKKEWQTLQNNYLIHEGEAIFVRKGANIIHKFFEQDFCALLIFVPDHFIRNVVLNLKERPAKNGLPDDSVIPIRFNNSIEAYFDSLFSYFYQEQSPPKKLLEIKFKELIMNLTCHSDNSEIRPATFSHHRQKHQSGGI